MPIRIVTFDAEMNNSGAQAAVRVIRLDDLDVRRAVASALPAHDAPGPDGLRLPSVSWPEPIGSGRRRAPAPFADPALPDEPRAPLAAPPAAHGPARLEVVRPRSPGADGTDGEIPRLPQGVVTTWPVRFQGSGHEYASLWLSNVLRIILTGGLYLPWARVRSQRFFMRRTRVAGHALDYHEPPGQLLPRYGLALCLLLGVAGAWTGAEQAGMLALSWALAVWPLLVFMSLKQRMAHISWARRRLDFDGLCQGVYQAMWAPLAGGGALAWLLMAAVIWHRPQGWLIWGVALALWLLALPTFVWVWFRFRQAHLRIGPLRLIWKAGRPAVHMLFLRTLVWTMLTTLFSLGMAAVVLAAMMALQTRPDVSWRNGLMLGAALLVLTAVRPYAQARLQNLVWNKSGNRHLRFRSKLPVSRFVMLQCRNALFLVLTLGLYWPWAAVATWRMRAQALAVWSRVDTEVLKANWPTHAALQAAKMAGSPAHVPGRD